MTAPHNPLVQFIQASVSGLSESSLEILEKTYVRQERKKGELLLSQGEVCRSLYFLVEGATRSFSVQEDRDITTWFSFKNEFITSFSSFFPQVPSYESIEMLVDGVLYQISRDSFISIRNQSPELERVVNHFTQLYAMQLERRLFLLQTGSALEKYQGLLNEEPHLVQNISSKHIASYLGITRETLSRIRSSIN